MALPSGDEHGHPISTLPDAEKGTIRSKRPVGGRHRFSSTLARSRTRRKKALRRPTTRHTWGQQTAGSDHPFHRVHSKYLESILDPDDQPVTVVELAVATVFIAVEHVRFEADNQIRAIVETNRR